MAFELRSLGIAIIPRMRARPMTFPREHNALPMPACGNPQHAETTEAIAAPKLRAQGEITVVGQLPRQI